MMMSYLILITLVFIQIVIGLDLTNVTYDDSYPVCPINLFRRKRALTEYTRWRATLETTPEFLVKVLDEDLTTPNSKPVVAVNIQPLTRGAEKIIVGGVIVPSVTTTQAVPEGHRDYTRFVPPTTIPVSRVADDVYLAPQTSPPDVIQPIKQNLQYVAASHSQRDESPPASPHFIVRPSSASYARQFAPIAPVAFTRRPAVTFAERKPTSPYTFQETLKVLPEASRPTRTSEHPEIIWPQRTRPSFDEISDFKKLIDDDLAELPLAQTSSRIMYNPVRTSTEKNNIDDESVLPMQTLQSDETVKYIKTNIEEDKKTYEDEHKKFEERQKIEEEHNKYDEEKKRLEEEKQKYDDEYRKIKEEMKDVVNKQFLDQIVQKSKISNKVDKDTDNMYSMMFYADEENDSSKKDDQDYDDKFKSMYMSVTTARYLEDDDIAPNRKLAVEKMIEPEFFNETKNNSVQKTHSKGVLDSDYDSVETVDTVSTNEKNKNTPPQPCTLIKLRNFDFNSPHTLAEITSQLKQWEEKSPLVKLEDITNGNLTTMENPIYLMAVDDPSSGQIVSAKQTVMIVAGIQGRDHHAVTAAMYVLYQLIERSESHTDLLTKYRFWIIPVFNPDGYDYSMTFPHRREWAKNLRQNWETCKNREMCAYCLMYGLRCTVQSCYGVNLDRNFEYQWIPTETLRAEHPCGSLYAGARQLSETETRALTDYLHAKRMLLVTFIAFKEGEVLGIMYPYSHTRKLRTFDSVYRQHASRAASAAYSISGRPYVAGQTSEFLPLYAGGIEDWVDGHLGIDNTYTVMMFRPTDSYYSKLITERVIHEAYAAMDTLLLQSVSPVVSPPSTLKRTNSSPKLYSQYCFITIPTTLLLIRLPVTK